MTDLAIGVGFSDPVAQSQATFRRVLDAMAHPGRIVDLAALSPVPADLPLSAAAAAIALTLADFETTVWLSPRLVEAAPWIRFHCGAPIVASPGTARFAFASASDALPPLRDFDLGTDDFPDRSSTLVLDVPTLAGGAVLRLSGPGIRSTAQLSVGAVPAGFWDERASLTELFPRGLDIVLTCGTQLAALPRTTRVEI
jgi:alpha-D-ribose 1-methylphosphonate 5-triphosphate synthase subunit PhnH